MEATMPAKLKLETLPAIPNDDGSFAVSISLIGNAGPHPSKVVEIKNVHDAEIAFTTYIEEVKGATDKPVAAMFRLTEGRAPAGFRAWEAKQKSYIGLNIPGRGA
jgi:hypothetical protein